MPTTTDTYTGKPFRYDTDVRYCGLIVPARYTKTAEHFLHPTRVPLDLLRELNPDADLPDAEAVHTIAAAA